MNFPEVGKAKNQSYISSVGFYKDLQVGEDGVREEILTSCSTNLS